MLEREREGWNGQKLKKDGITERHGKEKGDLGVGVPRDNISENDTRLQGLSLSSQNTQTKKTNKPKHRENKKLNYNLNMYFF